VKCQLRPLLVVAALFEPWGFIDIRGQSTQAV
jgi:hypothetical protein